MEYTIRRIKKGAIDFSKAETAVVAHYDWCGDYRPRVEAQVLFEEGAGFHLRMTAWESVTRAVHTQHNAMVCEDSCMEWFVDFAPAAGVGYINFEMNPRGTSYMAVGQARENRRFLQELVPIPPVEAKQQSDRWTVQLFVPLSLIDAIYGAQTFAPGTRLKGNFYKCGDETAQKHYGMWQPITWHKADFHRPEQFGDFVME